MKRKTGIILMIAGIVLILAALSLFLWNQWKDKQAGAFSENALLQVVDKIQARDPEGLIDGYSYIGYLSIPALGLELPVMSDWSYSRMELSPCRYSGSTKTNDLVIAAHNYIRHFGPIKNLSIGDQVYFTDMEGAVFSYQVEELDTLSPTAVEEMTAGEYDLTLFTCTYGGQSRVTVRCDYKME